MGSVTITNHQASLRHPAYTSLGRHVITASYSGDDNNLASASAQLIQNVKYPTSTSVVTSGSPSRLGELVTFTATVTSAFGTIANGGLVSFFNNGALMGTSTITNSVATFPTSTLRLNTHNIKATYGGSAEFAPSSGNVTQVVNP